MIEVYGVPNCNTVKKAIDWLKAHSLEYRFHDYKKEGISGEKLETWCQHFGWVNLLNKAGTTWRKLPEQVKAPITTEATAIKLMMENTSVIKRPVIEVGSKFLIRFNEDEYASMLLKK